MFPIWSAGIVGNRRETGSKRKINQADLWELRYIESTIFEIVPKLGYKRSMDRYLSFEPGYYGFNFTTFA